MANPNTEFTKSKTQVNKRLSQLIFVVIVGICLWGAYEYGGPIVSWVMFFVSISVILINMILSALFTADPLIDISGDDTELTYRQYDAKQSEMLEEDRSIADENVEQLKDQRLSSQLGLGFLYIFRSVSIYWFVLVSSAFKVVPLNWLGFLLLFVTLWSLVLYAAKVKVDNDKIDVVIAERQAKFTRGARIHVATVEGLHFLYFVMQLAVLAGLFGQA